MTIEIITTPNNKLKETGFGDIDACNSILNALKLIGHTSRINICENKQDLEKTLKRKPDLVILAVKYIVVKSEPDIWLCDYFKKHNINYTGSNRDVLKFDSNKATAKSYLKRRGIKTANHFVAFPKQYKEDELPLEFPLFLKPIDAANGKGIDDLSLVNNFQEYEKKIHSLFNLFKQPVLVEEYLEGREFTVAVIKKANNKLYAYAIEIVPPESKNGLRILGEKVKKENTEILKQIKNKSLKEKIQKLACECFYELKVQDFGRIDIKTNKKEECFFIEANLVPGMTEGSSYFPRACEISQNISYSKIVELMIEKPLSKFQKNIPVNINYRKLEAIS